MKDRLEFIGRTTIIHITTYILCGIVFSALFNYHALFSLENAKYFMRPVGGLSTLMGPLVQVVRGILFGVVLLLVKDHFTGKGGWLKLWALIAVIGIINTPAPAPFSIEGIVYTQLPLEFHLKGAPEILVQTLLFSYLIMKPKSKKEKSEFVRKNKVALIAAIIGGIGFSISGIVLTLIKKLDIMAGAGDLGAFAVMFIAMAAVFFTTKWYLQSFSKHKTFILAAVYYVSIAIMPTVYNLAVDSPFKSWLPLAINVIPVIIMLLFVSISTKQYDKRSEQNF